MHNKKNILFEKFFKMCPDLMMISRKKDAIYVAINDGFTKMLGYREDEVLHKSAINLGIWPNLEDRKKVIQVIETDGIIQNFETTLRDKNGNIIPVLISANCIDIEGVAHILGTARDISDLKQKEKNIRESEEKFKQLSELAPVGIYLTKSDGHCVYVNAYWREMAGLSLEEALGNGWINGIHPDDRQSIFDNWNKMVSEQGKWGLEYRFKNRKGKITWVYGVASPRKDLNDNIIGYVGVNVDITDRKHTLETVRESQLLLKSSLEAQKDTILFSIDKEYHYLYFNKAHQDAMKFSYDQDIAIGMNILDCMTNAEDKIVAKENYDKALQGQSHTNIRVFGDINLAYYESFFNPIYDDKNEIIGATGLARDITERTASEKALIASERKFHELFSSMMEGFSYHQIILNENKVPVDYIFIEMNHSFEKLTGICMSKAIGKRVTEVIPGIKQDSTDWISIYGKVATSGRSISFESYSVALKKWFLISAYSTQPGYFATLFQDITNRKIAEEEIKQLNETLEAKVQQRTMDLENSNKALEAFSYSVSHDLRAPLRAINGFSQILVQQYQDVLNSETSRLIKIVVDNTNRMDQLITGLLQISKVSSLEIKKNTIDMNDIVSSIIAENVSKEDKDRITFIIPPLFVGFGDYILIRQVWFNLLENAVKFSRKKEKPIIQLSSYPENNQIIYQIKDNGAGFNSAYQNKLYTIFQRLHSEEEFQGTGVGLALIHRIIQKHGGKVWAEGEEEKGATFYFSLPTEIK